MENTYYVYMLASGFNGTIYVGVTNNLVHRVAQHRAHLVEGFTKKHNVTRLVWYEQHGSIDHAIQREKRIKRWRRDWKIALFSETNPRWEDLYPTLAPHTPFG